jgi:hypothetical protein
MHSAAERSTACGVLYVWPDSCVVTTDGRSWPKRCVPAAVLVCEIVPGTGEVARFPACTGVILIFTGAATGWLAESKENGKAPCGNAGDAPTIQKNLYMQRPACSAARLFRF